MILIYLFYIAIFLVTVTIHEYAHGRVAYACGDRTASHAGRLSLNPLKHIDPLWTVALPLFLMMIGAPPIGMARPVPVNFMFLRHPRRDMIGVAIAGAVANLLFAALLAWLYHWHHWTLLLLPIYVNIGLALFNLLPIPPLDGARVLAGLLPSAWAYTFGKIESYGIFIIFALLWAGVLDQMLIPAMNVVCRLLQVPVIVIG